MGTYDSRPDTYRHIQAVQKFMGIAVRDLMARAERHDQSKLSDPERATFDEFTPRLKDSTYGSDEYKSFLEQMKPALRHHYKCNDHHPEHNIYYECSGCFKRFDEPFSGHCDVCGCNVFGQSGTLREMTLLSIIEMLCDWKAASMRHADGDIRKSIEINQKRFRYSDELKQILLNTLPLIESAV